jgi:hypothetical protein
MSAKNILESSFDAYTCPVNFTDLTGDANTLSCGHSFSSKFVESIYEKPQTEQCCVGKVITSIVNCLTCK